VQAVISIGDASAFRIAVVIGTIRKANASAVKPATIPIKRAAKTTIRTAGFIDLRLHEVRGNQVKHIAVYDGNERALALLFFFLCGHMK
jgi:hypothetical protein